LNVIGLAETHLSEGNKVHLSVKVISSSSILSLLFIEFVLFVLFILSVSDKIFLFKEFSSSSFSDIPEEYSLSYISSDGSYIFFVFILLFFYSLIINR